MLNKILDQMKSVFGDDSRRVKHALDVLKCASFLCDSEYPAGTEIKNTVELAAVLHDIGIKQAEALYNSSAPAYQHLEGPPIARSILKKTGLAEETLERICHIIGNHHLRSKIDGMDFQILWEADLLVNLPDFPVLNRDYKTYKKMVDHNFKTGTGARAALDLYDKNS